MSELKPCPWHDKEHVKAESRPYFEWVPDDAWENHLGYGWIECSFCGAHGPVCDDEAKATQAWNRRVELAEQDSLHNQRPCPICSEESEIEPII
ncbi:Lar family restriction alleviation protein [Candidatus Pacearchaeota archaeon]|nr:Lar family restriction alleviation protein [Candidatus Pacearchaeota archaeon]